MSRTIRRKGKVDIDYKWSVTQDLKYIEITGHFEWVDLEGDELAKSLAKYHSDAWNSYYSAPFVFRRIVNQKFRIKNKRVISKINKEGNYEEYLFIPFRKTVVHEWI
jgi:hypothetical protein